jgi:dihydropteroate synthase
VAKAAIAAGADMINDVSGGVFDPTMAPTAASLRVPYIIMHSRGTPQVLTIDYLLIYFSSNLF